MTVTITLDSMEMSKAGVEIFALTTSCAVFAFVLLCIYCAWKATCRKPLEFNMYIVEMYTMQNKRLVEVLHTGSNYDRNVPFSNQLDILRGRAVRQLSKDGALLRVSETNVVIQAPSNVVAPTAQSNIVNEQRNTLVLWDIEMPRSSAQTNAARDSQIAAAAALTILGRARYNGSSPSKDTVHRRVAIGRERSQTTSVVQMQYLQPIRRRGLAYLPLYRTPIALSLSRETVVSPDAPNRNSITPSDMPSLSTPHVASTESPSQNVQTSGCTEPGNRCGNSAGRNIRIRLKFLDDSQRIIETELNITVLQFKMNNFPTDMRDGKVIRLIFRGKLMRDDKLTLEAYGLHDDCIVHCHISNTPYEQPQQTSNAIPPSLQPNTRNEPANGDLERANVWLISIFLTFLTSQLAALPVQLRTNFVEVVGRYGPYLQPSERNNVFSNAYRRVYNYFNTMYSNDPVENAAAAAGAVRRPLCIGNFLLWIFGGQCVLVWMFVYYFPQLCDRTAMGLLLLLTLYFFFVVVPMPHRISRRQP